MKYCFLAQSKKIGQVQNHFGLTKRHKNVYFANLKSAQYFLSFGLNCKYFKNQMKSHITLLHTNWTSMRNLVYETDFNLSLFCHDLLDWPTQWTT